MAALLPSTSRGKYALAAILLFVAVAAGVVVTQRWSGDGSGLFGSDLFGSSADRSGATRSADAAEGLTGITAVDDVLGALLGRSPGERTVAISGKGKGKGPARAYRFARSPTAQALQDAFGSPVGASRVIDDRPAPAAAAPSFFLPDVLPGAVGAAPPAGLVLPSFPGGGGVGGPGGFFFAPPGGFSIGGPGGGGGGGVIPPVTPPGGPGTPPTGPGTPPTSPGNPPLPPVMPAIPEPSTWLMMLLGMAFVGASMRAGKISQAEPTFRTV